MVRNQIELVVSQLVAAPQFLYGTAKELNLLVDDASFPVVMLYTLQPSDLNFTLSYSINTKYSVYMEFLYKTEFDQYSADNEAIVTNANYLLKEFLVKLSQFRLTPTSPRYFKVKKGGNMKSVPVYNKFDVNTTGVNLMLTLDNMDNYNYDPTTRPPGYTGP